MSIEDPTQRAKRNREDLPPTSSSINGGGGVIITEDATDRAFRAMTSLLEGQEFGIAQWSSENRSKLSEMLSMYLAFGGGSSEGNRSDCGGDSDTLSIASGTSSQVARAKVARDARIPDAKQFAKSKQSDKHLKDTGAKMMLTLSLAKDVIKNMLPPTDVDTKAKAPTYEEDICTFEIDGFLFEDEEEIDDQLVDPGYVSRFYCTQCGEHRHVVPTRFISHSFTRQQLTYLFNHVVPKFVLPQLEGGTSNPPGQSGSRAELNFLDIGSRFGVVPIAASCILQESSGWKGIRGIEFNKKYFDLSRVALQKIESRASVGEASSSRKGRRGDNKTTFFPDGTHSTSSLSRVEFINKDALGDDGGLELMAQADLLCFNNVFEWYTNTEELLGAWEKVRTATRGAATGAGGASAASSATKKKYLITNPSLEESLTPLFRKEIVGRDNSDVGEANDDDDETPPEVIQFLQEWGVKEIDLTTTGLHFTRCFFEPDAESPDDEQIQPLHLYELSLPHVV